LGLPRFHRRRILNAIAGAVVGLLVPIVASAHSLSGRVQTPLPFVAYLAGACVAVGFSFLLIALSDPGPPRDAAPGRVRSVPAPVRLALRGIGLLGWLWIAAQTVIGSSSDSDVASLFLWVYGWIGLAIVSAALGPVWRWLDPFTTLHDLGAWALRRLGGVGVAPRPWPDRLGRWPAVVGFAFFVWLELVAKVAEGRLLGMVLIGYTLVTLVGMAQYGRDPWRERGETFGAWFSQLGRLAAWTAVGPGTDGQVRRQPFGSGLITRPWSVALLVLVALGTGSIIYDGISQTRVFFDVFGIPTPLVGTVLLFAFLGVIVAAVLGVSSRVGITAMGAGLLPVAVGYLVAHYLSTLLVDGQRILVAVSDPFQQGWDLFGTAFIEPDASWLPTPAVWTMQVGAVVVGHVIGAWAGHAASRSTAGADGVTAGGREETRRSQVPLAVLMVVLTALTLWSLGQNLVFESETHAAGSVTIVPPGPA
jgi:hypothetical protein